MEPCVEQVQPDGPYTGSPLGMAKFPSLSAPILRPGSSSRTLSLETRRDLTTAEWPSSPPDATANVNAGPFPLEQPTTGSSGAVPPIEPAIFSSRTHLPRISTKGWSIADLNSSKYASFQPVPRVSALAGATELSKAMAEHESRGTPLVIVDYDKHESWPREMFSLEWLLKTSGDQEINVRNIHDRSDHRMPLAKFVETSQSQSVHSVAGESQRLYWKDADCPLQWREWLLHHSPILPNILPGSPDDYLGYLSESETVESLLCYMGIGDTYTAAHKDLCCSSGHNLMCFSEDNSSSYWFMTAADDATAVAKYFHKHLKQELDWETHVTSLEELGRAPFTVYVVEQRVGDLILVPPRSCHQVVNSGGLAMKTSWSRMTLDSLETALHSELPIYRRVCRPEQYRVKTVIYRSILHLTQAVRDALTHSADSDEDELLPCPILPTDSSFPTGSTKHNVSHSSEDIAVRARKLKRLVQLFDEVLRDEYASRHADLGHVLRSEPSTGLRLVSTPVASSSSPQLASSSRATITFRPPREPDADCENPRAQDRTASCNFACDFCGADIFQSFFECNSCPREDGSVTVQRRPGDGILICPTCYVEGRNCDCADMVPMQCRPFDMLLSDRNEAARVVTSALPLGEALSATRKSDIRSAKGVCVFEAACALRDHREQTADGRLGTCRPNNSQSGAKAKTKSHQDAPSNLLRCKVCHSAKCFRHLLHEGTHSAEAILEYRDSPKDGMKWHSFHRRNAEAMKHLNVKKKYFNLDGVSDVTERLRIAALSFPKCRPGHAKVTLGFYDKESEVEDPFVDEVHVRPMVIDATSTNAEVDPPSRSSSPLTAYDSGSEQDSGSGDSPARNPRRQPSTQPSIAVLSEALPVDDETEIIELEYSDSDIPRAVMYVSVPPMPRYISERKRTFSSSGDSANHTRKKPKSVDSGNSSHVHAGSSGVRDVAGEDDRPPRAHEPAPDEELSPSDMDAAVADNTAALGLVEALQAANNASPVFAASRPVIKKPKRRPNTVPSSSDDHLSPTPKPAAPVSVPGMTLAYPEIEDTHTPSLSGTAIASSSTANERAPRPPLSRITSTKRARAAAPLEPEGPASGHTGSGTPAASADTLGPAAKRRKGPPGITTQEMAKRRDQEQNEGAAPTKVKKPKPAAVSSDGPSNLQRPRNGSDSRHLTVNGPTARRSGPSVRSANTKRPQGASATSAPTSYLLPDKNAPEPPVELYTVIGTAGKQKDEARPQSSATTVNASRAQDRSHPQPAPAESSAATVPSTPAFAPEIPQSAVQLSSKANDPDTAFLGATRSFLSGIVAAHMEDLRPHGPDQRMVDQLAALARAFEESQQKQAEQEAKRVAQEEKQAAQEARLVAQERKQASQEEELAALRRSLQETSEALRTTKEELKEAMKEGRRTHVQVQAERVRTDKVQNHIAILMERDRVSREKVEHIEAAMANSMPMTEAMVRECVANMIDARMTKIAEASQLQPTMTASGMIWAAMPINTHMRAPSQEMQQSPNYNQPQGEFPPPNYPNYPTQNNQNNQNNDNRGWHRPPQGGFPRDGQGQNHPHPQHHNRPFQIPHPPGPPRGGPSRDHTPQNGPQLTTGPPLQWGPVPPPAPARNNLPEKPYSGWGQATLPDVSLDNRRDTRQDRPSDSRRHSRREASPAASHKSQRGESRERSRASSHRDRAAADTQESSRDRHRDSSSSHRRRHHESSHREDGVSERHRERSHTMHSRTRGRSQSPRSSRHRRNAADSPVSEQDHRDRQRGAELTPPSTNDSYPSPTEHVRHSSPTARDARARLSEPTKRESPAYVSLSRDHRDRDPREQSPRRSSSRALDDARSGRKF